MKIVVNAVLGWGKLECVRKLDLATLRTPRLRWNARIFTLRFERSNMNAPIGTLAQT
jgi:hypothetical protein